MLLTCGPVTRRNDWLPCHTLDSKLRELKYVLYECDNSQSRNNTEDYDSKNGFEGFSFESKFLIICIEIFHNMYFG